MHNKHLVRITVLAISAVLCGVMAVDKNKFRTCAQSPFCRPSHVRAPPSVTSISGDEQIIQVQYSSGLSLAMSVFREGIIGIRSGKGKIQRDFVGGSDSLSAISWMPVFPSLPNDLSMLSNDGNTCLRASADGIMLVTGSSIIRLEEPEISDSHNHIRLLFNEPQTFYGLPLHTTALQLPVTHNVSASEPLRFYNSDVFEYELDSPMALYGSVPFAIARSAADAKRFAGIFWNDPSDTFVDIHHDGVTFMSEGAGNALDLYIYLPEGDSDSEIKSVISRHARLTGQPAMPPLFSLGYHQCRWNYRDEKDVKEVDQGFDQHGIPYDVIWLDIEHTMDKRYFTFDPHRFPNPDSLSKYLDQKGKRKLVVIVDPHIKADPEYAIYNELIGGGYAVLGEDPGSAAFEGNCWPGKSSWVDFFNEAASRWWALLFPRHYPQHNIHIWNDMNEPAVFNIEELSFPRNAQHKSGGQLVRHAAVHNLYGQYMHSATRDGLLLRSPNQRPFVLSRSFYAGSQSIGPIWTGDNAARWEHLRASIPMVLSLGLAGMPFVGADVGGFFGNPEPELLLRWYQLGALQPFFRGHAHIETKRREPWLFGEPWTGHIKRAIRTRYRLLPYIYTLFYRSHQTGVPVNRPVFMEFPDDTWPADDQFMLGESIFASPVLYKNAQHVAFNPPIGSDRWYDFESLKLIKGAHLVDVTLGSIPLFLRGGRIIPTKDMPRRSTGAMASDPLTLIVALDSKQEAKGQVYIDSGDSFDYLKGNRCHSALVMKDSRLENKPLPGQVKVFGAASVTIRTIHILGLEQATIPTIAVNGDKLAPEKYSPGSDGTLTLNSLELRLDQEWVVQVL